MGFYKKILPLLLLASAVGHAQTAQDKASIDKLCGCFAVTFNYAETFTNDTMNTFKSHPRDNRSVVEYELPIRQDAEKSRHSAYSCGPGWNGDKTLARGLGF